MPRSKNHLKRRIGRLTTEVLQVKEERRVAVARRASAEKRARGLVDRIWVAVEAGQLDDEVARQLLNETPFVYAVDKEMRVMRRDIVASMNQALFGGAL